MILLTGTGHKLRQPDKQEIANFPKFQRFSERPGVAAAGGCGAVVQ
jgi:hypothetical protein